MGGARVSPGRSVRRFSSLEARSARPLVVLGTALPPPVLGTALPPPVLGTALPPPLLERSSCPEGRTGVVAGVEADGRLGVDM